MGKRQIIEKMNVHIKSMCNNPSAIEEKDAVYVFVEIRKYMEQENLKTKYPIVWFFANWVLHPSKDVVPEAINKILIQDTDGYHAFISMDLLKDQLVQLSSDCSFYSGFTDKGVWDSFRKRLIGVLSEQPLRKWVDCMERSRGGRIEKELTFYTNESSDELRVEFTYS